MPITSFSEHLKSELDVEQYLSRMNFESKLDRKFIYRDVVCPICRCKGARIVSATESKQAHFRFRSHEYFCDYNSTLNKSLKGLKGISVNFGDNRTNQTKIIREWVARGIEQKKFSQETIEDMRRFFYEAKVNTQYKMNISKEHLEWFKFFINLNDNLLFYAPHIKLNLSSAKETDFNWRKFAEIVFIKENYQLIKKSKQLYRVIKNQQFETKLSQVEKLINKTDCNMIYDAKNLYTPYRNTIILSDKINKLSLKMQKIKKLDRDIIYAFAALLLYISKWDVDSAWEMFVKILTSPDAADINSGNVIGLNPFYNFETWLITSKLKQISEAMNNRTDYKSEIDLIERQLKNEYRLLNIPKDDSQTE